MMYEAEVTVNAGSAVSEIYLVKITNIYINKRGAILTYVVVWLAVDIALAIAVPFESNMKRHDWTSGLVVLRKQ